MPQNFTCIYIYTGEIPYIQGSGAITLCVRMCGIIEKGRKLMERPCQVMVRCQIRKLVNSEGSQNILRSSTSTLMMYTCVYECDRIYFSQKVCIDIKSVFYICMMVYSVDRCARVERRGWWLLSPAFMASRSARSPGPPLLLPPLLYNIQTLPRV